VVLDQLAMLSKNGYEPTLLVMASEDWEQPADLFADPAVQLVQYPKVKWVNAEEEEDAFFSDIDQLTNALEAALENIDVALTHDLIYMPRFIKLHLAARRVAEKNSKLKWLHWIHSATSPSQLKREGIADLLFEDLLAKHWPGSYPVFFNSMSRSRIAQNFSYDESAVKVIPHPTNVSDFFSLSPLATRLYEEKQLYQADFVTTVPARLDRGKQVEWVIRIFACLKSLGNSVRVLVMDFHSQSAEKNGYRQDLKALAADWGLSDSDITFISEFDQSVRVEAPHSLVRELLLLSTVYIQPSRSESYSLSAQEAALCGNLLVLNADFPPLREIFGEQALYCQFSSNIDRVQLLDGTTELTVQAVEFQQRPTGYPNNSITHVNGSWWVDGFACHAFSIAQRITHQFSINMVLKQRQERLRDRNIFSVFSQHLEPLIEAVCADSEF
jgi:glycosyltransferase involved in cell wall biosynthesis